MAISPGVPMSVLASPPPGVPLFDPVPPGLETFARLDVLRLDRNQLAGFLSATLRHRFPVTLVANGEEGRLPCCPN